MYLIRVCALAITANSFSPHSVLIFVDFFPEALIGWHTSDLSPRVSLGDEPTQRVGLEARRRASIGAARVPLPMPTTGPPPCSPRSPHGAAVGETRLPAAFPLRLAVPSRWCPPPLPRRLLCRLQPLHGRRPGVRGGVLLAAVAPPPTTTHGQQRRRLSHGRAHGRMPVAGLACRIRCDRHPWRVAAPLPVWWG